MALELGELTLVASSVDGVASGAGLTAPRWNRAAMSDRLADLLMAGIDAVDLPAMEERLTPRIENSRLELRGAMAELWSDFGELRGQFGDLRGELGLLEGRTLAGFGAVHESLGELRADLAKQGRSNVIAIISANAVVAGLVLAALQIVT